MKTLLVALLAAALWMEPGAAFAAAEAPATSGEPPRSGEDEAAPEDGDAESEAPSEAPGTDGDGASEDAEEAGETKEGEETAANPEVEERDEDDLVEIRGLVFEFYVADDSQETQLAIEAPDRDYLVAPGNTAEALAEQLGKTVRAQGWPVPDDLGDIWLALYAFEVTD